MTTVTLRNMTSEDVNLVCHPPVKLYALGSIEPPTEKTLANGSSVQLYHLTQDGTAPDATELADAQKVKIANFTPTQNRQEANVWDGKTIIMTFSLQEETTVEYPFSKWMFSWSSQSTTAHTLTLNKIECPAE